MMRYRKRIEEIVWYLFRKYDVKNCGYEEKIQNIVDYCMDDLQKHPDLKDALDTNARIEFFVLQSILYILLD